MPASKKPARITKRTPVVVVPATAVKVGDILSTRDGDALTITRCYKRNGEIVMHFADNNAHIPMSAAVTIFNVN